jgi:hypothetical protein
MVPNSGPSSCNRKARGSCARGVDSLQWPKNISLTPVRVVHGRPHRQASSPRNGRILGRFSHIRKLEAKVRTEAHDFIAARGKANAAGSIPGIYLLERELSESGALKTEKSIRHPSGAVSRRGKTCRQSHKAPETLLCNSPDRRLVEKDYGSHLPYLTGFRTFCFEFQEKNSYPYFLASVLTL